MKRLIVMDKKGRKENGMKNKKYSFFMWLFICVGFLIGLSTPVKAEVISQTDSEIGIYFDGNTPEPSETIVSQTKDKIKLPQTGETRSIQLTLMGLVMTTSLVILISKQKRKEEF